MKNKYTLLVTVFLSSFLVLLYRIQPHDEGFTICVRRQYC